MPSFKLLTGICMLALLNTNIIDYAKAQEMPDYGEGDYPERPDYPRPDYPNYPDPRSRMGMGDYGDMGGMGGPGMGGPGMGRRGRGMGGPGMKKNELVVGTKRFKLYEKKRLNYKKAKEFCKKKDGKLAEAQSLEEMRRLESLFTRARMIGMDVWVYVDKKLWKKHSLQEAKHPGLNLDSKGMEQAGIKAMMMGGGQKEMCPAISLSTRNLAPVMCMQPLGFICEYDRNRPRTTKKPKPKGNSTTKASKKQKKKIKKKDEMRK